MQISDTRIAGVLFVESKMEKMKAKLKLEFIYDLEQLDFVVLQEKLHSLMNELSSYGALDGFKIAHKKISNKTDPKKKLQIQTFDEI